MILYASLKLHACSFITMQLQNNGKVNFNHFPSLFQCHQIKYVISMERNPAILHTITLCNRCVTVKLKNKYKESFFSHDTRMLMAICQNKLFFLSKLRSPNCMQLPF